MPIRRYKPRSRKVRRPLSSFRRLKGKRFGRRSALARRPLKRRVRRLTRRGPSTRRVSNSRFRSSSSSRLIATKAGKSRSIGRKPKRVPRPPRNFARNVDIVTHNPLSHTLESNASLRWAPAACGWYQYELGGTATTTDILTDAIANYRGPAVPDATTVAAQKGIYCMVDNLSVNIFSMNAVNNTVFVSVYLCYPRHDVTISDKTPYEYLHGSGGAGNYVDEAQINSSTATQAIFPPSDYRYTPYMHHALCSDYKIKFVKNVKLAPGATFKFKHSLKMKLRDSDDGITAVHKMRKRKGVYVIYKAWGEWGIKNQTGEPTIAYLRTGEGQLGMLAEEKRNYHVAQDIRPIMSQQYITGDNTGITTTLDIPRPDAGYYNTYGPNLGTF